MIRILISVLFMVTNILATADLLSERATIDFEPNNSIEAAESIEFDRDVDGNISTWYVPSSCLVGRFICYILQ